jgi:hypothetical protein
MKFTVTYKRDDSSRDIKSPKRKKNMDQSDFESKTQHYLPNRFVFHFTKPMTDTESHNYIYT